MKSIPRRITKEVQVYKKSGSKSSGSKVLTKIRRLVEVISREELSKVFAYSDLKKYLAEIYI